MSGDRFEELKEKYVSVLSVLNKKNFQVQNMHVEHDKLLIRAIAPDQDSKNAFWNAVKAVSADYAKDFTGDITVKPAPAKVEAPAPAAVTPVAAKAEAPAEQTYTVVAGDTLS